MHALISSRENTDLKAGEPVENNNGSALESAALLDDFQKMDSVGLLGSCVSRDFRIAFFPNTTKISILWRISSFSMNSENTKDILVDTSDLLEIERRTFENDLNKKFNISDLTNQKYIITDFFRDTYAIAELHDGRFTTMGPEYDKYKLLDRLEIKRNFIFLEKEFAELWFDAINKFAENLNKTETTLIIVPTLSLHGFVDENSFIPVNEYHTIISKRNKAMYLMERITALLVKKSYLVPILPNEIKLDPNHEYGIGSAHYNSAEYYKRLQFYIRSGGVEIRSDASMSMDERIARSRLLLKYWNS